jgi:hypothetical protein
MKTNGIQWWCIGENNGEHRQQLEFNHQNMEIEDVLPSKYEIPNMVVPQITQVTSWDVHHAPMVPGFDLRGSHHSIHYSIAFVLDNAGFNQPKYGMWWEFMGYMEWETQKLLIFVCFFNGMHPPFFGHHRDNYDKPLLVGGSNQPLWKIWKSVGMIYSHMLWKKSNCSKPTRFYIPWELATGGMITSGSSPWRLKPIERCISHQ